MDIHKHGDQTALGGGVDQTAFMTRPPLEMPLNLADWVAPSKIAEWIQEALRKLDPQKPEVLNFLRHPPGERPETVMMVLVFAYATQRFVSGEIFQACHSDPMLKQLCEGQPPFANELEHYRRTHRVLLEHLLGQILIRAVQEKFLDAGGVPPGLEHQLFDRAIDQINIARHMSTWEE